MPTHSAKCKSGLLSHHLYTEPTSIYRTDIYTYSSFCYVGKKKKKLHWHITPFFSFWLPRSTACYTLTPGTGLETVKVMERSLSTLTAFWIVTVISKLLQVFKENRETSASKRDFMFGDLTCVYNSLYKENVLNRLLGAIDKAYGQKKKRGICYTLLFYLLKFS